MALHERIKKLLKESGKRPVDLANYVKVSRASVADWMSGNTKTISSANAFKVAKFFNVSAEWVATGSGPQRVIRTDETDDNQYYDPDKEKITAEFIALISKDIRRTDMEMLKQMIRCISEKYTEKVKR